MKKKIFTRFYMLAMLILFATSSLQAQNWVNNQSTMMHTGLKTNLYAQKVKPYSDQYLVGISKHLDSVKYCFSLWENNNHSVYESFIDTTGISINDFTILGDSIYFCGNIETAPNTWYGILGRFNINDFLNDGNFNYSFVYIPGVIDLTRLVAYYSGTGNISLMAIGHNTLNGTAPGRVVHLNYNINATNPSCQVFGCPFISNTEKEIMHDICFLDNEIVTLSHIYPTNKYIVRAYSNTSTFSNIGKVVYSFPNYQFNVSSDVYEFPLRLTGISELKMAACVSVINGSKYFTMVNILKRASYYVLSTQLVSHYDKSNKPLEMEYSSECNKLLLLNDSYHVGKGMVQTITHLNPDSIADYYSVKDLFAKPNELNHLSILPNKKYAVAGVTPLVPPSTPQMVSVRNIMSEPTSCVNNTKVMINFVNMPNGAIDSTAGVLSSFILGWNNGTATNSGEVINVYCYE